MWNVIGTFSIIFIDDISIHMPSQFITIYTCDHVFLVITPLLSDWAGSKISAAKEKYNNTHCTRPSDFFMRVWLARLEKKRSESVLNVLGTFPHFIFFNARFPTHWY